VVFRRPLKKSELTIKKALTKHLMPSPSALPLVR
jgi:hypothetical protein